MTQNRHNAVIHLGHQNGVVSLWTPNLPHPAVQLLAHLGPVVGLSVDPSTGGRYMASSGADGTVKVWDCRNWKGAVREWTTRGGGAELEWSAKGALAVATGGSVNVRPIHPLHTRYRACSRVCRRYTRNRRYRRFFLPKWPRHCTSRIRYLTDRSLQYGSAHSRTSLRSGTMRVSPHFSYPGLENPTLTAPKLILLKTRSGGRNARSRVSWTRSALGIRAAHNEVC